MRFVEGGYLLYLQRHTYVCTQTQKKGKRKKKGTIIRRRPPLVCPARSPKKRKKSASEEDTYEPSRLFIHDGVMLPPTIPLPEHHLLLHPSNVCCYVGLQTSDMLGLDLQSQTAEEARLLLLGLLSISVRLIGFLGCGILLGVERVLAVGAVVGGQSLGGKKLLLVDWFLNKEEWEL